MPPEVVLPAKQQPLLPAIPQAWQPPLRLLALLNLFLIVAFLPDWTEMAWQWWNTSTYTHVLLIPPIIAWLVWQRWPQMRALVPHGWWPGLLLFAGAAFLWVLGSFAGLNIGRQAGAVAMTGSGVLTVLGPRVGRALAFPLFYLAFLVPFGDELVPPLQMITAKLTIGLVHMTGVKATIDGVFIDTPAGLFEVAEACSGVKFLVAMIAFGVLACHVCFRSWKRRFAFMTFCLVAPVLANGVRAWGTIYIAQYVGVERASGFDHIVYGWFFFAAVIALVIAAGWRYFDRDAAAPLVDDGALQQSRLLSRLSRMDMAQGRAVAIMVALVIAGLGWSGAASRLSAPVPKQVFLPDVPGWTRVDYVPATWWEPRARGADHRLLGSYADGRGHKVDVFFALYSGQSEGREAGGFGEGALMPNSPWQWLSPGPEVQNAKSDRLIAASGEVRLAETRYRTGALVTGSDTKLRLATMRDRLLLRARPTMALILSAQSEHGGQPAEAIASFRKEIGDAGSWMDRMAGLR